MRLLVRANIFFVVFIGKHIRSIHVSFTTYLSFFTFTPEGLYTHTHTLGTILHHLAPHFYWSTKISSDSVSCSRSLLFRCVLWVALGKLFLFSVSSLVLEDLLDLGRSPLFLFFFSLVLVCISWWWCRTGVCCERKGYYLFMVREGRWEWTAPVYDWWDSWMCIYVYDCSGY